MGKKKKPTFRVTVERLDTFVVFVLNATWTPRSSGPPTGVTTDWGYDLGGRAAVVGGDEFDLGPGREAVLGADENCEAHIDAQKALLRAAQEMLRTV